MATYSTIPGNGRPSAPPLPTDEEVAAWLRSKGISFWGQGYMIVEGDGSVRAVAWIQNQISSFLEWRESNA